MVSSVTITFNRPSRNCPNRLRRLSGVSGKGTAGLSISGTSVKSIVVEDVDPVEAAEWLARMFLSFIADEGRWDLADEEQVTRLVDDQLLAGIVL